MAAACKCLGQSNPSATTATTLYTAAGSAGTNFTVVSALYVCNQGTAVDTFRVWTAIHAAGDAASQYIAYGMPIAPNETITFRGICMDGTDLLRIYAGTTSLSFVAFGEEN